MSNAMNNSCWLDISHSSFWIAACITTSFTCPVTSWHQHNPRSRKGTAAKLDLQQSRGSNKQVIKEKNQHATQTKAINEFFARLAMLCGLLTSTATVVITCFVFCQHARATQTLPRAQCSTCYQPVLLTHPLGFCQKLFNPLLCLWSQPVLSNASLCFLVIRRLLHTWWVLGDLPWCDEPVHLECVAEAAKEPFAIHAYADILPTFASYAGC